MYSKDYHLQLKAPFGKNRERIEHPCPRPLEQIKYIINLCTQPDNHVLDPFGGSGTTAVACVKIGRRCTSIEIDEGYHDISMKRVAEAQMQPRLL